MFNITPDHTPHDSSSPRRWEFNKSKITDKLLNQLADQGNQLLGQPWPTASSSSIANYTPLNEATDQCEQELFSNILKFYHLEYYNQQHAGSDLFAKSQLQELRLTMAESAIAKRHQMLAVLHRLVQFDEVLTRQPEFRPQMRKGLIIKLEEMLLHTSMMNMLHRDGLLLELANGFSCKSHLPIEVKPLAFLCVEASFMGDDARKVRVSPAKGSPLIQFSSPHLSRDKRSQGLTLQLDISDFESRYLQIPVNNLLAFRMNCYNQEFVVALLGNNYESVVQSLSNNGLIDWETATKYYSTGSIHFGLTHIYNGWHLKRDNRRELFKLTITNEQSKNLLSNEDRHHFASEGFDYRFRPSTYRSGILYYYIHSLPEDSPFLKFMHVSSSAAAFDKLLRYDSLSLVRPKLESYLKRQRRAGKLHPGDWLILRLVEIAAELRRIPRE